MCILQDYYHLWGCSVTFKCKMVTLVLYFTAAFRSSKLFGYTIKTKGNGKNIAKKMLKNSKVSLKKKRECYK